MTKNKPFNISDVLVELGVNDLFKKQTGEYNISEVIFDFVFGIVVPYLQLNSEVWLTLSEDGHKLIGDEGDIKLNANTCKFYSYHNKDRQVSVDVSINGKCGLIKFEPGEYYSAYIHTTIGTKDLVHIILQFVFDNITDGLNKIIVGKDEEVDNNIISTEGNVVNVNFGSKNVKTKPNVDKE